LYNWTPYKGCLEDGSPYCYPQLPVSSALSNNLLTGLTPVCKKSRASMPAGGFEAAIILSQKKHQERL